MSSPPASDTPTIVRPERFIIGSARLDPASWSITPTSVSSGGVLARGFVGYARLGKLGTAIGFTSMVRFEAPAGLDVHRFQYFLRDGAGAGNIVELWCGQVSARFTVVSNRRTACLRPLGNGFMFYPTEEEHTTMMSSGSHFVYPDLVRNQRVTIVDQNTPAEMPFALSVILKGLSDRSADIEFSVRHDGDTTRIWRADVPLDAEGLAQLPLWTHTLQIRRIAQNSAQATLIPQGTGEGPVDRFPGGLP